MRLVENVFTTPFNHLNTKFDSKRVVKKTVIFYIFLEKGFPSKYPKVRFSLPVIEYIYFYII